MKPLLLLLGFLIVFGAHAQPVLLKTLADAEIDPRYTDSMESGTVVVEYNGKLYFLAKSSDLGSEIFSTDGTVAGTTMLKDIIPGFRGIELSGGMGATQNSLFFGISDGSNHSLWKSDGTTAGTIKVADVHFDKRTGRFAAFNNLIFFVAYDPEHGNEVWRSDGTPEGTFMLKDIFPGDFGSVWDEFGMVSTSNGVYFVVNDGTNGSEVWTSDGTTVGTKLVKNTNPDNGPVAGMRITSNGDYVYFYSKESSMESMQLYRTNGTDAGTIRMTDGPELLRQDKPFFIGDKVLVRAADGAGFEWYAIDNNTFEIVLLKDVYPGTQPQSNGPDYWVPPVLYKNFCYFLAASDVGKYSLWKTDGTPENTSLIVEMANPQYQQPWVLNATNDKLFISYLNGENGGTQRIAVSDGSSSLSDVFSGLNVFQLVPVNNKMLAIARGDVGAEPYISDGTVSNTFILRDINKGQKAAAQSFLKNGPNFSFFDQKLNNVDLWQSDGTANNTKLIKNINGYLSGTPASNGNRTLFAIQDLSGIVRPWISDGSAAGTRELLNSSGASINLYGSGYFHWVGSKGYFLTTERGLWTTDGTQAGTSLLTKLLVQVESPNLMTFKNQLYFFLEDKLLRSDGTAPGTNMLIDPSGINPGEPARGVIAGTNKIFFSLALNTSNGWELWTSDGTTAGTKLVKDIHTSESPGPEVQMVLNDIAYFTAGDGSDRELWRSDGTIDGTYILRDINTGIKGSYPKTLGAIGNTIYFTADDGSHGRELWKTDGTSQGTVLAFDIVPGPSSSDPFSGYVVGDVLYFIADDGTHGNELWSLKGTQATMVADLSAGIASTFEPGAIPMTSLESKFFFLTNDPGVGVKLWRFESQAVIPTDPGPDPVTGLDDELQETVKVWPNPATNQILIESPPQFKTIHLRDIFGRSISTTDVTQDQTILNVAHLPRGIYVVTIKGINNANVSRKVILK